MTFKAELDGFGDQDLFKIDQVLDNPRVADVIKTIYETPHLRKRADLYNLSIILQKGGIHVFRFGEGIKNIYDEDMLSAFINAVVSLFYKEFTSKFDFFKIESLDDALIQKKALFIYSTDNIILTCYVINQSHKHRKDKKDKMAFSEYSSKNSFDESLFYEDKIREFMVFLGKLFEENAFLK